MKSWNLQLFKQEWTFQFKSILLNKIRLTLLIQILLMKGLKTRFDFSELINQVFN
jgi:uncharacterized protein involved in cysteine biosynthesis